MVSWTPNCKSQWSFSVYTLSLCGTPFLLKKNFFFFFLWQGLSCPGHWDLSSLTRDGTYILCLERQILNHSPWNHEESDTTKWLTHTHVYICMYMGFPGGSVVKNLPPNVGDASSIPGLERSPGEENGKPLQDSYLRNPMGRGTWWAINHGVTRVGHNLVTKQSQQYTCDSLEKTLMLGGIGGRRRRGRQDEMAGWHHWLDGRESEWTPGVGDGQGGLACCDSWGRKESDTTERLIWLIYTYVCVCVHIYIYKTGSLSCIPETNMTL